MVKILSENLYCQLLAILYTNPASESYMRYSE